MREMKDVWKELKRRGDGDEEEPLTRPRSSVPPGGRGKQSPNSAAEYKATTAEDDAAEADYFETGFTLREVGPQAIRLWLGMQIMGLLFQFLLWNEVSSHLSEYDDVVSTECAHDRLKHGICTGPMWNISTWQDVVLSATGIGGRPSSHSFQFSTASRPPTFLLVADPVSWSEAGSKGLADPAAAPAELAEQDTELRAARWSLEVERTKPPQAGPALRHFHSGQDALTFEDLSSEAHDMLAGGGRVEWRATLTHRGTSKRLVRYVAFVEDVASTQLGEAHASAQCAFGRSWKAFNMLQQGHSHRALSWCRILLGVFLFVGASAVYFVHSELRKGPPGYRFHLVVAAKFLLQDVAQQVCIVLYLLGWYEAAGLRCQLCLFRPHHCSAEQAFHLANFIAFACTLMSSVANQLLIRPVFKRAYTEDDLCIQYSIRIGGTCVSVLPFTTGLCLASRSVLPAPGFLHLVAAVPCGIGWLALLGMICVPAMLCCDEDCGDDL